MPGDLAEQELIDKALTGQIINRVTDLVTAINMAVAQGLSVALKVDASQVREHYVSETQTRIKRLDQPPVRVWRETKYA